MSKKARSQANSSRAATGAFGGGGGGGFGFGSGASFSAFGASASPLSYVSEPPDLSSISDANTVVAFKNLSKKDSTTKAKALEDLQSTVTSSGTPVENAVLEAWVRSSRSCKYKEVVLMKAHSARFKYILVHPLTQLDESVSLRTPCKARLPQHVESVLQNICPKLSVPGWPDSTIMTNLSRWLRKLPSKPSSLRPKRCTISTKPFNSKFSSIAET